MEVCMNRRQHGHKNRSEGFVEEKNFLLPLGIET